MSCEVTSEITSQDIFFPEDQPRRRIFPNYSSKYLKMDEPQGDILWSPYTSPGAICFLPEMFKPVVFKTDFSSVWPQILVENETFSSGEAISDSEIIAEMLSHDLIVRMPPQRTFSMQIKISKVKKARPKVVKPDWF